MFSLEELSIVFFNPVVLMMMMMVRTVIEEDNDGSGNYQDHDNGDHRNVGVDDDSDGNDDDADGNDDEDDEECLRSFSLLSILN